MTVTAGAVGGGFYLDDDGAGIPGTGREAVFESGYSTTADGTGFGRVIVADMIEAHGWEVRVVDGDAGGARFGLTGIGPPQRHRPESVRPGPRNAIDPTSTVVHRS